MMSFTEWANVLLFPVGVLIAVTVVLLVHRRDEARWKATAEAERARHRPAE
jgi:hypothetical protein